MRLTRREREVLEMIPTHLSAKEMAAKLNISEHGLKYHLSNLYRKFGVSDRQALNCLLCEKK